MHGTGLSCSLGRIFHGVGCTVCVCRIKYEENCLTRDSLHFNVSIIFIVAIAAIRCHGFSYNEI
jgi:hypothetical protein